MEQIGETRVLFRTRRFTTLLHVDEDGRDPNNLVTSFTLIRSVRALFSLSCRTHLLAGPQYLHARSGLQAAKQE